MAIIKQYHRDTNTTYVYESISYWDAEKGQSRSRRKCIGKIDPDTGEIIPTGKRGRKKKEPHPGTAGQEPDRVDPHYEELLKENLLFKSRITELEKKCASITAEKESLQAAMQQISRIISGI